MTWPLSLYEAALSVAKHRVVVKMSRLLVEIAIVYILALFSAALEATQSEFPNSNKIMFLES